MKAIIAIVIKLVILYLDLATTNNDALPMLSCQETQSTKQTLLSMECNTIKTIISCHKNYNHSQGIQYGHAQRSATFTVLELLPDTYTAEDENIAFCIGLNEWNVSLPSGYVHNLSFTANLSIGVLIANKKCWMSQGTDCAQAVLLREDVTLLPPLLFTPNWYEFWNFSSPLLRAALGWPRALYVEGLTIRFYSQPVRGLSGTAFTRLAINGYFGEDASGPVPAIQHMPRLAELEISNSWISDFKAEYINGTNNIKHLRLDGNQLKSTPTCITVLPNLITLSIESNSEIFKLNPDVMKDLKNLKCLSLAKTPLKYPSRQLLILPELKNLSLSGCNLTTFNSTYFNFPALESLDLSDNLFLSLAESSFTCYPHLKRLDLSRNFLTQLSHKLFEDLLNLNYINIGFNDLIEWPKLPEIHFENIILKNNTLTTIVNLGRQGTSVSYLDIAQNNISHWEDPDIFILSHLNSGNNKGSYFQLHENIGSSWRHTSLNKTKRPWVRGVNMSGNYIQAFSEAMLASLRSLEEVDLGGNIIDCASCQTPLLQRWLNATQKTEVLILGKHSVLECMFPVELQGRPVAAVAFDEQACRDPRARLWWGLGLPLLAAVAAFGLLGGAACRFRTELAYLAHLARVRSAKRGAGRARGDNTYDAFVCYSGKNRKWVLRRLARLLERPPERYRLCLFDRDFRLGSHIVTNIVDAIEHSNKVIVVLSKNFIESKWCQWEMEMAQHKLFAEDREFLVLLELEALERRRLPRLLRFLLDTRAVVRWPRPETAASVLAAAAQLRRVLGPSLHATTAPVTTNPAPSASAPANSQSQGCALGDEHTSCFAGDEETLQEEVLPVCSTEEERTALLSD